jgi:hypothetical protein
MAAIAFISYSHTDERLLERLHTHLAALKRDGALSAWTDHAILPGARFEDAISAQLERSNLFIALVSPDYIASRYCYETEFQRAFALTEAGKMRIVPVILEHCDWLSTPLRKFLALPKDGLPISTWTNQNEAFLDVVTGLRRVLKTPLEGADTDFRPASGSAVRQPLPAPIYKYPDLVRKRYEFRQFPMTHEERLWLEETYRCFREGKKIVTRIRRRELAGSLSPSFDPASIDRRLLTPGETLTPNDGTITLLGIWQLEPETEWIGKVDLVLRYVQQIIRSNLHTDELLVEDIAKNLNLSVADISASLDLAQSIGLSFVVAGTGGTWTREDYPRHYTNFRVGHEKSFQLYEHYEDIEKAINAFASNL